MTIGEKVKRLRDKNLWFTKEMSKRMENALWGKTKVQKNVQEEKN